MKNILPRVIRLTRLIQQEPSSNFFVRTFEKIRNFLHSYFPSIIIFQSPLKVTLEEVMPAETAQNAEMGKYLSFLHGLLSFFGLNEAPMDKKTIRDTVKMTLTAFIESKINNERELNGALIRYIDEVKDKLNTKPSSSLATVCPESWYAVRQAMENTTVTPELEDILIKVKLLYPCTVKYDDLYNKQPAAPMKNDSTRAMANKGLNLTPSLNGTDALTGPHTKSVWNMFMPTFGSNQPLPDEMQPSTTQQKRVLIQQRIHNLGIKNAPNNCSNIKGIETLQSTLNEYLSAVTGRASEGSEYLLNRKINDFIAKKISIKEPVNISDDSETIEKARTILKTLHGDIIKLKDLFISERGENDSEGLNQLGTVRRL